ncbi:hypothetical protein BLAT2472_80296 [Burkholderia latens]
MMHIAPEAFATDDKETSRNEG